MLWNYLIDYEKKDPMSGPQHDGASNIFEIWGAKLSENANKDQEPDMGYTELPRLFGTIYN